MHSLGAVEVESLGRSRSQSVLKGLKSVVLEPLDLRRLRSKLLELVDGLGTVAVGGLGAAEFRDQS